MLQESIWESATPLCMDYSLNTCEYTSFQSFVKQKGEGSTFVKQKGEGSTFVKQKEEGSTFVKQKGEGSTFASFKY